MAGLFGHGDPSVNADSGMSIGGGCCGVSDESDELSVDGAAKRVRFVVGGASDDELLTSGGAGSSESECLISFVLFGVVLDVGSAAVVRL